MADVNGVPTLPSWADLQAIKLQHERLEKRARQIRVGRLPHITVRTDESFITVQNEDGTLTRHETT